MTRMTPRSLSCKGNPRAQGGKRIFSVFLLLLLFSGISLYLYHTGEGFPPGSRETCATRNLFAMDTFFILEAYGEHGDAALQEGEKRIAQLEEKLSVTREGSDVWKINHGDGEKVSVSEDTFSLISFALEMGEQTGGALEITLYPVLREWGFTLDRDEGEFRVPSRERLHALLELVDFHQVVLDPEERTVSVPAGVQIDLGAVAKGYTGDCLIKLLREEGVSSALLNLGGNVHALGTKPDGSPWRVGVTDPFDVEKKLGVVEVADKAVVTSGSYERYFEDEEGNRYGHILDAEDGCPADSGLVSVTVVGDSGALCDALSTALYVMGRDEAVRYWQGQDNFEMVLVTGTGELYLTEGLADCFEAAEGFAPQVISKSGEGSWKIGKGNL